MSELKALPVIPEPHVCRPPRARAGILDFFLGRWGFERGTLWDCDCGQQYVFDPEAFPGYSAVWVMGTQRWPWISCWPYRYELRADGRLLRKQVSFWPGHTPTAEELAGEVVQSWG